MPKLGSPGDVSRIAVLATLNTKGAEARFVATRLAELGATPLLVDLSLRPGASELGDITWAEIDADLDALDVDRNDKSALMEGVAQAAARRLARLAEAGELAAVLGLGGGQGTWLCASVMRGLRLGLPKVLVTTIPQRAPLHVGASDIVVVPSVADISGLNRILRPVLASSAAAVVAMAAASEAEASTGGDLVGLTMFGVTTPGTEAVRARLEQLGFEVAVFHANGVGGRIFERLIDENRFRGVIDFTTTELADELVSGYATAGPERLTAAARHGLPQVVVPGALDVINFGAPDTVPRRFAGRVFHQHTPVATLMRTNAAEYSQLATVIAEKLNRARGPVVVALPLGGFSELDAPGGPFYNPQADAGFVEALERLLRPGIEVVRSECSINDERFAEVVVEHFLRLIDGRSGLEPLP